MTFGIKTRKLAKFGKKMMKAGVFGLKNGGKLAALAGTVTANPTIMAAGATASQLGEGLEKI